MYNLSTSQGDVVKVTNHVQFSLRKQEADESDEAELEAANRIRALLERGVPLQWTEVAFLFFIMNMQYCV